MKYLPKFLARFFKKAQPAEITKSVITEHIGEISKTANLAENFDLALILGIVANARKQGKETELANIVLEYGIENNLANRL